MKSEYVIKKGRGDVYVEIYRSDDETDAIERFTQYLAKHGTPSHYNELAGYRSAGYMGGTSKAYWFELVEEQL